MEFSIGQTFTGTYPPEAAVWCNTHNAYIKEIPTGFQIIAIPGPTPEGTRAEKLELLKVEHANAEKVGIVHSSLGFPVDANDRANRDVSGLISQMEMTSVSTTQFCDANNDFHEVTLDNLKTLQLELTQYAQSLYATKWQLRSAIEAATSVDELNAIEIKFVTDFTPTQMVITNDASH